MLSNTECFGFIWYATSVGPYLLLMCLYHYHGSRFNVLYIKPTRDTRLCKVPSIDMTLDISDDEHIIQAPSCIVNAHKKETRKILGVDPVRPQKSFMVENIPLIAKHLNRGTKSKA